MWHDGYIMMERTQISLDSEVLRQAKAKAADLGVSLAEYVRGTEHWSRQIATDPEIERRFHEALRGART